MQVFGAKMTVWASVTISNPGFIRRKDLLATASDVSGRGYSRQYISLPFSRIVGAFPFQTIRMSDVILILLVELVVRYVAERFSPERNSFVN